MPANMADYITVAERVNAAKDDILHIAADTPTMLDGSMGYIRVVVSLKDGRSATGTASFRLDLTGGRAQATNPIEDCETSAVGRALALLGYHSSRSIASREEVAEAQRRSGAQFEQPRERAIQGAQPRTKPNAPAAQQSAPALAPMSEVSRATTVTRIRTNMRRSQDFGFNDPRKLAVDLEALSDADLMMADQVWKERADKLAAEDARGIAA